MANAALHKRVIHIELIDLFTSQFRSSNSAAEIQFQMWFRAKDNVPKDRLLFVVTPKPSNILYCLITICGNVLSTIQSFIYIHMLCFPSEVNETSTENPTTTLVN